MSTETYVVTYGDERGNDARHDYTPATLDAGIEMALSMIRAMGVSTDDAFIPSNAYAGSIETNLHAYIACAIPWASIYYMGSGDDSFSVHGYSEEFGNWSVSMTVVS